MTIFKINAPLGAKEYAELELQNRRAANASWLPPGFMFDRPVPEPWTARLREISPLSDEMGWLALTWEPGDPWGPGQRWTIYEMVHIKHILADYTEDEIDLEDEYIDPRITEIFGPHPRSAGHMCTDKVPTQFQCLCRRKSGAWKGGPCSIITLTQWKLFREHDSRYFPVPFWVIQGEAGGHKQEFNENEKLLLRNANLPQEPPRIGEMPYADFDERVIRAITGYNRLWAMSKSIEDYKKTMGEGYAAYKAEVAKGMRRDYLAWLEEQVMEEGDMFTVAARKGQLDNQRKTEIDYVKLSELNDQHFIETGVVLDQSQI